jgi:hypothetical protein
MPVSRALPTRTADSAAAATPSRSGAYGEAYVLGLGGGNHHYADEGSYFTISNATLATGIAGHAAPVVADTDTKALLHIFNGGVKNIIFDHLFLEVTAAGTGGTIHYTVVYIDNKGSTALTSGGTSITAINNCNSASSLASGAVVTFGAAVVAMTSSKKVGQQIAREVINVVQDTLLMKFGGPNAGERSGLTTAGTATNHLVQHFAPVVIGPGGNLNIALIRPSQSAAASYQFSAGWIER